MENLDAAACVIRYPLLRGVPHVELTPGIVIFVVIAAALSLALVLWGRRHEAAGPLDAPRPPASKQPGTERERNESPLVNWLLDRAAEQTGMTLDGDSLVRERMEQAAVKAMEELQTHQSATISLPFLTADARGPKHFTVTFKRNPDSTFEQQA